jgi:hypothetical protein
MIILATHPAQAARYHLATAYVTGQITLITGLATQRAKCPRHDLRHSQGELTRTK